MAQQRRHGLVAEPETRMRVAFAQLLERMRREIDDRDARAGRRNPASLVEHGLRVLGIMQHLVQQDRVGRGIGQRQRVKIALDQIDRTALHMLQLGARQTQHFRAAVDGGAVVGGGAEQFDHPPGAGADIEQPAERAVVDHGGQCGLDLGLGHIERADRIPLAGVLREEIRRALIAHGANRAQLLTVAGMLRRQRLAHRVLAAQKRIEQPRGRMVAAWQGGAQEDPAAFLVPFGQASLRQDADVARHARLALVEHLRQFAHRQLHQLQQQHDAQPAIVGQCPEEGSMSMEGHIKKSLYVVNAAWRLSGPTAARPPKQSLLTPHRQSQPKRLQRQNFGAKCARPTVGARLKLVGTVVTCLTPFGLISAFRQGRKFKMKSIISIASVAALSLALAACGAEKTEEAATAEATAEEAADAGMEAAEAAGDAAAEATEAAGEATEAAAEGAVDAAEAGADKAAAAAGEAKDAAKEATAAAGEAAKK